ncbi:MAG: trehalase family glycosidase [Chloroflexota bacterium]
MAEKFIYEETSFVQKNRFRTLQPEAFEIPDFSTIKDQLPDPVLPEFPEWLAIYWRSWEAVWRVGRLPNLKNGLLRPYLDSGYNQNMFMWDTSFMSQLAIYGRNAFDFSLAFDNFYAKQHADGFICREISMQTGCDYFAPFDPNSTGPNIMPWAEWRLFRQTGDVQRLAKVFWPLVAYHRWCQNNRTWPSGLYWATGMSSAMDNQPRVPDSNKHHRHWTWVDASFQAAVSVSVLEQMALVLEENKLAEKLSHEKTALVSQINAQLWSDKSEFFLDKDANGRFSDVKTVGAFWGLQEKSLIPKERRHSFIQHLRDSWSFGVHHPVPTQSSDSEGYNSLTGNYWRGAVWPTATYMVLKGLRQSKQHKLVHKIARKHLEHVTAVFQETGTLWQNYAPEQTAPGEPSKADFWGVSAITPIAILLEDVIGIHVDWPQSRVYWDRRLKTNGAYGVKNYPLGVDGILDLVGDEEKLVVTTDTPFTLVVRDSTLNMQAAVSPGTTEIPLD